MARMPSHRRSFQDRPQSPNLTPIMNLVMLLIPCLLISTIFIEVTVLNASAPGLLTAVAELSPFFSFVMERLSLSLALMNRGDASPHPQAPC